MAGAPQEIRFTRGIDAQNDPRTAEAPYLLAAENVYFDREGGPRKRNGYGLMTNQTRSGAGGVGTISATNVTTLKDEALVFNDAGLFAYSDALGTWTDKGVVYPATASQRPASPASASQTFCDAQAGSTYEVLIYQNVATPGNIYLTIRDRTSGGYLRYNELVAQSDSTSPMPRVMRTSTGYALFYRRSDGWYARAIASSIMNGGAIVGAETKISVGTGLADVVWDGMYAQMAVATASGQVTTYAVLGNMSVAFSRVIGSLPAGTCSAINLANYVPNSTIGSGVGKYVLTYAVAPSTFPSSASATVAQSVVDLVANTTLVAQSTFTVSNAVAIKQVAASYRYDADLYTAITWRVAGGAGPYTDSGQYAMRVFRGTGLVNTALQTVNLTLASQPFFYANSASPFAQPYAFVAQANSRLAAYTYTSGAGTATSATTSQGSVFVLNLSNGSVVTQIGYGVSVASDGPPPPVMAGDNSLFEVPVAKTVKLVASASSASSFDAINYQYIYGVRFVSANQLQSVRLGDIRYFAGGLARMYDGASITEQGFLLAPEIVDMSFPFAGSMAAGTYQVCAVYEWVDRQGATHRSAPGPVATLTLGTASTNLPSITVSSLSATAKTNVSVALYGTKAGGTIFYRLTAGSVDTTQSGVSFTLVSFPVGATSAETLYTTGGILPNDPWPNNATITASRNRVFVAGGDDGEVVQYSKAFSKSEGLGMSLAFTKRIASAPGPITALAAMDDKVIVFKQHSILYFYGQNGPGPDGSNDDFSASQLLTTEVGCISKLSVLTTAEGVYFQSQKGIWLLSRSMGLSFVGQPIAPLTAGKTITSAVLMPSQTAVRFGSLDGAVYVYHYRQVAQYGESLSCGQWTTFANMRQTHATLYRGAYAFARTDGRVCVENTSYLDDTTPVSFTLRTAWIRAGTLLQWGSYSDLALLGAYEAPHTLLVRVYRDYRSSTDTLLKYLTSTAMQTTQWGQDPSWGSQSPWGGYSDDTYVARWRLPNACAGLATISFSLSDAGTSSSGLAASCQILGLNLLGQAQSELAHIGDRKRQ